MHKNFILFFTILISSVITSGEATAAKSENGKSITLEQTRDNCGKIQSLYKGDDIKVASKFNVNINGFDLAWMTFTSLSKGLTPARCGVVFRSTGGPIHCIPLYIYSMDGGKTAYAKLSSPAGDVYCE